MEGDADDNDDDQGGDDYDDDDDDVMMKMMMVMMMMLIDLIGWGNFTYRGQVFLQGSNCTYRIKLHL